MNNDFSAVIARFKKAANLESDADVARLLDVSRAAFSNRKASNSIPYKEIVLAATALSLDLNAIFYDEMEAPEGADSEESIDAKQALSIVLDVINDMGLSEQLTSEQLQTLIGYTFTYNASRKKLKDFLTHAMRLMRE